MCEYPELGEFIESFADRYTRRTESGAALAVTDEEQRMLGEFFAQGLAEWAEATRSSDALDQPALGKFLEEYADRRSRSSDIGAAVEVSEEEIIGLGLFFSRGFIGWKLRLDRNRGRFEGFDEIIERKRASFPGPFSRRVVVGVA